MTADEFGDGVTEAEHLARVERQRDAALATVERVKALHHSRYGRDADCCTVDNQVWPCSTIRALAQTVGHEPPQVSVTHACPPRGAGGLTPCCGRTPFELPRTDRMTSDPALVTCGIEDPS